MTTMHRLEVPERTKLLKRFGPAYIRLNKVDADLLIRMVRLTQINLKRAGISYFLNGLSKMTRSLFDRQILA
jgi:hypothetical protein